MQQKTSVFHKRNSATFLSTFSKEFLCLSPWNFFLWILWLKFQFELFYHHGLVAELWACSSKFICNYICSTLHKNYVARKCTNWPPQLYNSTLMGKTHCTSTTSEFYWILDIIWILEFRKWITNQVICINFSKIGFKGKVLIKIKVNLNYKIHD